MLIAGVLLHVLSLAAPGPGTDESIHEARSLVAAVRDTADIPGISAAVAVGNEVVWSAAFGFADREASLPAQPDTRFRIGSVSKVITAALLARLLDRGNLDLDAPVQAYLPDYPDQGPITPRMLAGHLAGIRHYQLADFHPDPLDARHFDSVTEALQVFADDPLAFEPGTQYGYSSFGYNLLSAVLEVAGRDEFLALVDREVVTPIGLEDTLPDRVQEEIPRRSARYDWSSSGAVEPSPVTDPSYKWASAGYLSTAADLARFGSAHLFSAAGGDAPFLSRETLELLFTSQVAGTGEETGVGLGWRLAQDRSGRRYVHHGGSISGGRAMIVVYPEHGVTVALACNLGNAAFAEHEAVLIAQSFLDASEDESPLAAGNYTFEREGHEWSFDLAVGEEHFVGTLTDPSVGEIPLVSIQLLGEETRLIWKHPEGPLVMWLLPDGDGYFGTANLVGEAPDLVRVQQR